MAKQTYLLTADNEIVAYPSRKEAEAAADQAGDDCHGFDSTDTLEAVLASGPATRAVEIWNGLPGVEPVKGFKSKGQAASRIFKQLSSLGAGEPEETTDAEASKPVAKPKKAKRPRKAAKEPKPRKSAKKAKKAKKGPAKASKSGAKPEAGDSKKGQVIAMISKKGGATLEDIMGQMGWQRHTCRGMLATLKTKGGLNVESFKTEAGERAYRIA